ncbi:MAG: CPBP family intramembrane metalloprotease [Lachnospiraceae bacterium]|nr:CPBP family intramembrane metalloprotease [Lachnospiraceae bacterium]
MKRDKLPYLLPIRSVVFLIIFLAGSRITSKQLNDMSSWWTTVATIVNILTVIMLIYISRKNDMTYLDLIGYRKGDTPIKQIVIISVMILSVGGGGMYLAGFLCYGILPYSPPMMIAPVPKVLALINFFLLPVTTALAEDGLYLGCGVNVIKNKTCAILVPAFFYTLQHSFIPVLIDARYIAYRFLSYLPLIIILCLYYHKKRNPLPIMVGHALIDLMTVIWVLASSFIPGFYEMMCSMAS